ncbi:ABC transporter ATP-binding protein [Alicyclobacillus cellulosilyticus]|uniref:ABC transporter ATP-binding protein n=1 Tax=Alicyclobacillus cellulosilyticus TaxID=1003997 RepID=A0A917NN68_9BACL|nr:ABC transporter permease [Alicyclobacillus cellulosilyticus]GGJ12747.1 ABC transporter ATP-binding protein [Alicyclobacillus cellulosilyticus]
MGGMTWVRRYLPPALIFIGFLILWQAVCVLGRIPPYLIPTPVQVFWAIIVHWSTLWDATWITLESAFFGFLLSIVIGVAVAFIMSQAKWIERSLYPYAILLQTVPIVAVAPLVIIWVGAGMRAIVVIAFLIAVFPIISNTNFGFLSTDQNLISLVKMYNRSRWMMAVKVRFPSALPQMFAGLKISAGLAVIGAIVGQFVAGMGGSTGGLGYLITETSQNLQMDYLFAAVFASAVLGIFHFGLVNLISTLCIGRWHESALVKD